MSKNLQVKKVIEKILLEEEKYLLTLGFHLKDKDSFIFKKEGLPNEWIFGGVKRIAGKLLGLINYGKKIEEIDKFWTDYALELHISENEYSTTINYNYVYAWPEVIEKSFYNKAPRGIIIEATENGIEEYISCFKIIIEDKILKLSNKLHNISDLDKAINFSFEYTEEIKKILSWQGAPYKKMIVAKLSGNPNYEVICSKMLEECNKQAEFGNDPEYEYMKNYPIIWKKVKDNLDGMEQLENPILS